jgi:hypothetical protein
MHFILDPASTRRYSDFSFAPSRHGKMQKPIASSDSADPTAKLGAHNCPTSNRSPRRARLTGAIVAAALDQKPVLRPLLLHRLESVVYPPAETVNHHLNHLTGTGEFSTGVDILKEDVRFFVEIRNGSLGHYLPFRRPERSSWAA